MDRRRWGARVPAAAVSAVCVAAVVAGLLLATGAATPAVALAPSGHWVVNAAERAVVHVDGGTAQVDARVELPADAGEPLFALQGEQQGFVVARERITVFGRSTLTVDTSIPVDFDEVPVGIETVGGPYLVYRTAGTVVRLGVPSLSLPIGGSVARPVWTDDGTVWVQRTDDGSICALRSGTDALDCSVGAVQGEPGGLTVTGADAAFVGTRRDAAQVVARTLGAPVGLGEDVAEVSLLADRDTEGRLAVVEPGLNRLVLADSAGVPEGRVGGAATTVDLGPGDFTSPVAAGGVIAVLDLATNRLLTYDVAGTLLGTAQLPPGEPPTLSRGADGRIYIDDADGAMTHVIGPDGGVTSVGTGGRLSDVVAVAAPPERRSPVLPPPVRSGPSVGGPGTGGPIGSPVEGPPPIGSPLPNPPTGLAAPTGVTARVEGSAVVVSWQPIDSGGKPVAYTVASSAGPTNSTQATTARFDGLPIGVDITFTVQGTANGSISPPSSPSSAVRLPGPAGAPSPIGVQLTPASGASPFVLTWPRPDLNGGELVEYEVRGTDLFGQAVDLRAAGESVRGNLVNCEAPYTVEVRALTRLPGETTSTPGAPATAIVDNGLDCSITGRITAQASGADQAVVTIETDGGGDAFNGGDCALEFDGVVRWTGTCSQRNSGRPVTVAGLDGGTTYSIRLTVTVPGHGTTTSNTVSVTTEPSGPLTGDINGDGEVDCADKAILDSQWQQTGPGLSADLNNDEAVDVTDLSIMMSNWTGGSQTC